MIERRILNENKKIESAFQRRKHSENVKNDFSFSWFAMHDLKFNANMKKYVVSKNRLTLLQKSTLLNDNSMQ